jgi:hypothetical protein
MFLSYDWEPAKDSLSDWNLVVRSFLYAGTDLTMRMLEGRV